MQTWTVELTADGYLRLPAELAQTYFVHDTLVAVVREGELWLLPTRGPGGGGLLLKQRNRLGDRSVVIWEVLPADTAPGVRSAAWDATHGALRCRL